MHGALCLPFYLSVFLSPCPPVQLSARPLAPPPTLRGSGSNPSLSAGVGDRLPRSAGNRFARLLLVADP